MSDANPIIQFSKWEVLGTSAANPDNPNERLF